MRQPTSPAGRDNDGRGEDGFSLLEVVCVVAILAILAGIAGPLFSRSTSRAQLESYAIATAAVLKADRNAAIRRQIEVATQVDAGSRMVRSGATDRVIRMPGDVAVDTLLAARCGRDRSGGRAIRFFSSGMSCGGTIALTRSHVSYEIRVNWFTGGVDIVSFNRT